MNNVYILGGAQTDFERNWTKEGKTVIALLREVIEDCLESTGLTYDKIIELNQEGKISCFMGNFLAEYYINQGHTGALLTEIDKAFFGVPSARYEAACASGSVALDAAISKIKSGDCEVALVIGWELMKTVDSKVGSDYLGRAAFYETEAAGIEYPFPKLFGKLSEEILFKYQLDEKLFLESLAHISNKNYSNAKRNKKAQTRKWFMNKQQANCRNVETNPIVGGKLAVSDCSQVTDGAAAVILVSGKYMSENKLGKLPLIKGYGHRVAPMIFDKKIEESKNDKFILPWTKQAVNDALRRASLHHEDIDFFETHDCFTSSEYAAVSVFGLSDPGKEYEVILDGLTDFNGKSPINPSGGLIGCGHPVGASGVRMILDLYKQVSGKAEEYQLVKAKNGLMLNIGGSATTNYVFIVGEG